MKKNLYCLIAFFLLAAPHVNAQWTQLLSGSIAELRSAYFFNTQTGFVVGSDTVVLKTIDAGANWTPISSGTNDTLRCIFFTDDTTGYTCGAQGTIMKTTDGGNTWLPQVSGLTSLLRSVHFPTHDMGYIAGGDGTILKTTDGGANWVQQVSGTIQDLISIRFVNPDTGYAVSSLSTFMSGLILKTVDGGSAWDTVHVNTYGFLSVFPVNNDTVYAVGGNGTIVKTTDGGSSWSTLPNSNINVLRSVVFLTADTGYAAGDAGTQLFTTDGGTSWISQGIQPSGVLGMYFPAHDTGYAVGTAGIILRYSAPCPLPAQPAQIFGGTTICEGASIDFYINAIPGATSYAWTGPPGSSIIAGQGDTLVTILLGNSSGNVSATAYNLCGAGPPLMLLVQVHPLPAVPVVTANGSGLNTDPATTWQWYLNGTLIPGADTAVYFPLTNGNYTVVVTNNFGCSATSAPFSVVNAGISGATNEYMTVQPMPFIEQFTITWNHAFSAVEKVLVIYDVQGKKCMELDILPSSETLVNAAGLDPGMYFYALMQHQQVVYRGTIMKQ